MKMSWENASRALRCGDLTPRELVDACLCQIERLEPRLQAWVVVDREGAIAQAEAARQASRNGAFKPLLGLPIGVKDIIDVAGFPTLAGSRLRAETPAEYLARDDAPIVAALRRAGAIILGKTVTVEFACFDPSPTRNPWDQGVAADPERAVHSAGGSSSGSAAAVAAGMCLAALGTQTGGSLVRPASYCGICAMKPTYGRVDGRGIVPVSDHFDTPGPMADSARALAAMFEHLPRGADFGPPEHVASSAAFDAKESRPRIGVVQPFFFDRSEPRILKALAVAVEQLRAAGALVEEIEYEPDVSFLRLLEIHTTVMAADAAAFHKNDYPRRRDAYGPMIASLLDTGLDLSAVDVALALADLRRARRSAASQWGAFDALLAPATDTTAPRSRDTTGPKTFQAPWSCLGLPVVSLPCGLGDDGMPIAVQLVGRFHEDSQLLALATWCEKAFGFRSEPPVS